MFLLLRAPREEQLPSLGLGLAPDPARGIGRETVTENAEKDPAPDPAGGIGIKTETVTRDSVSLVAATMIKDTQST